MRTPSVLIVEDDAALAPLVVRHLTESGFDVRWEADGAAVFDRVEERLPDIVVLDLMLPGLDGLTLCRRLRKDHDLAIVMVTARGEEADRIRGLELGADDYLPKPFSLWELEARLRAVLRRYGGAAAAPSTSRTVGPLTLDLAGRGVRRGDAIVDLTRSEFDILARLTSEPGRVFTRDQLLESVQGGETEAFDRAIDTHISNLRRKIGDDPRAPRLVRTVWGVGYRFEAGE